MGVQLFIVFSHGFLYFCSISCDFSFCIFYFAYLGFFSPLLGESSQRFVNLIYLFKESALGFIDFFYCFLISILLISALIFMTSFLLLTLGFVCSSFSNSFKWWVKLSI